MTSNDWETAFYSRVTAEFTLTRTTLTTTHQWIITLAIGAITAVLALGQGGFLFPSESGFIAVLVILPLMLRFFVRSCLEYTLFHRWLAIKLAQDEYFLAKAKKKGQNAAKIKLNKAIETYYIGRWSPKPFRKMIVDNLTLAFYWPFLLVLLLTLLGVAIQEQTFLVIVVMRVVAVMLLVEFYLFFRYDRFQYRSIE